MRGGASLFPGGLNLALFIPSPISSVLVRPALLPDREKEELGELWCWKEVPEGDEVEEAWSRGEAAAAAAVLVSVYSGRSPNRSKTRHLHKEEGPRDRDQDQASEAAPGLLGHCVETREHSDQELRHREAQQLDCGLWKT